MGKTRPDPMEVDEVTKKDRKEKKNLDGKVTKHDRRDKKPKKAEKPNHQAGSDASEDESSKGSADEGGAALEDFAPGRGPMENLEGSLTRLKKQQKREEQREERLREEALKILMEKELGSSLGASNLHIETKQATKRQAKAERRRGRRAEKRAKKQEATDLMGSAAFPADEAGDIFMIDVNPTPVDPAKLKPLSDDEDVDMEDGGAPLKQHKIAGYTAPPSGMNRTVRRRLKLIEKEKAKIQKRLGVPEGSDEKAPEVQELLDQWIKTFDEKTEIRDSKKKDRRTKQVARIQHKRGKTLAGIQRKEKDKGHLRQTQISRDIEIVS